MHARTHTRADTCVCTRVHPRARTRVTARQGRGRATSHGWVTRTGTGTHRGGRGAPTGLSGGCRQGAGKVRQRPFRHGAAFASIARARHPGVGDTASGSWGLPPPPPQRAASPAPLCPSVCPNEDNGGRGGGLDAVLASHRLHLRRDRGGVTVVWPRWPGRGRGSAPVVVAGTDRRTDRGTRRMLGLGHPRDMDAVGSELVGTP